MPGRLYKVEYTTGDNTTESTIGLDADSQQGVESIKNAVADGLSFDSAVITVTKNE